jgi:hypothetical protein
MRRILLRTLAGLCLVPLVGASEASARPPKPSGLPAVIKKVEDSKPTCGKHGTQVDFLDTPTAAARQAKKEGKLVFILHVSGNFEDPRFT